jgi:hypothetical protein
MKYHFTEPNNCCTVAFGGSRLPSIDTEAGAGPDCGCHVAASVMPCGVPHRGDDRHA